MHVCRPKIWSMLVQVALVLASWLDTYLRRKIEESICLEDQPSSEQRGLNYVVKEIAIFNLFNV